MDHDLNNIEVTVNLERYGNANYENIHRRRLIKKEELQKQELRVGGKITLYTITNGTLNYLTISAI